MTDQKELRTKKCSDVGCRMEVVSISGKKYYCKQHFNKVRFKQRDHKYWRMWG